MADSDISRLELLLREHFAKTDKQLSDMRVDNAEFRTEMIKEFQTFTEKIDSRIGALETRVDAKIDALDKKFDAKIDALDKKFEAKFDALDKKFETKFDTVQVQIHEMQNDITGLKHDVGNMFTWNYWMLSVILALMVMPHITEGIKSLFSVLYRRNISVNRIVPPQGQKLMRVKIPSPKNFRGGTIFLHFQHS